MNNKECLIKIQNEIDRLNQYLLEIPGDDYLEKGITLGKINGLLTAKLYVIDLEDNK